MSLRSKSTKKHIPIEESAIDSENLEDLPYYHGHLPRAEITNLLEDNGDFLIRASLNVPKKGVYLVMSVKYDGKVGHFPLHSYGPNRKECYLEGDHFPSVSEFVKFHMKTAMPLTTTSGAIIRNPITKYAWLLDNRDITIDKCLGKGQFGEVCLGKIHDPKNPNKLRKVAIKKFSTNGPMSDEEKAEFLREAKLMLSYEHPNVVRVMGVAADKQPIMIVMELCEKGSLDVYLTTHSCNVEQKVKMCCDAARGMEYLSTRPVPCVHRDLAARNCLLGAKGQVKISDFGMSKEGTYKIMRKDTSQVMLPIRWTAPETLIKHEYTTKSDVYTFGIMCWEIFSDAMLPFSSVTNIQQVYKLIRQGAKQLPPPKTPNSVYQLFLECWTFDENLRPTFTDIREKFERIHNQIKTKNSDFLYETGYFMVPNEVSQ